MADSARASDAQVMQGDVVKSTLRTDGPLGWICCITPESDEAHIYWQPGRNVPSADSREPLKSLQCVDRALIPGDIVRRCDIGVGQGHDRGGRDRDAMGMVVGTEVMLDLRMLEESIGTSIGTADMPLRRGVPASSLRHLVPIRLVTWAAHRSDGWLGRVQSWDEDLVLRFKDDRGSCCRIRAANMKQDRLGIAESFYRDFFPGLTVLVSAAELRNGNQCEWLSGSADAVLAQLDAAGKSGSQARIEAVIEDLVVGSVRVDWLAQVPLRRGLSSEQPPRHDGCPEDNLLFLLGEAEYSSRWALGDRLRADGSMAEVCNVETFVDVRWQDDALSVRVPARELQLCNPDAFSFFPSELVCQRVLDESGPQGAGYRAAALAPSSPATAPDGTAAGDGAGGGQSEGMSAAPDGSASEAGRGKDEQVPRVGCAVRADPASRMVCVRWLDETSPGAEEEWSAFDLQIDPEFGYRLGDAVIRCRDWEESALREETGQESDDVEPRVGQVAALESGSVRVRWLDGTVSLHAPRELYRVGDEEEASLAESQELAGANDAEGGSAAEDPAKRDAASKEPEAEPPAAPAVDSEDKDQARGRSPSGSPVGNESNKSAEEVTTEDASTGRSGASEGTLAEPASCGASSSGATAATADRAQDSASALMTVDSAPLAQAAADIEPGEVSLEDMVWELLPTDHHFMHCPAQPTGPSGRQFVRRMQREWQILQRGLPRNLWVHVYPDRMDLLRACLVGPEGTPYSEALFFFDVYCPPTYPQVPPQVKFWSFGENLNPNLYENGKVCLSLLGTWSGKDSETWSPERSNLLQVLVSILGLVLNTEPYYNEPGFERERDTPQGVLRSQRYNESVALSSYHLMLRVLRLPPVDFERVSRRHFAERRTAILARSQHLQDGDGGSCSEGFRKSLAALMPRLVEALPQDLPL